MVVHKHLHTMHICTDTTNIHIQTCTTKTVTEHKTTPSVHGSQWLDCGPVPTHGVALTPDAPVPAPGVATTSPRERTSSNIFQAWIQRSTIQDSLISGIKSVPARPVEGSTAYLVLRNPKGLSIQPDHGVARLYACIWNHLNGFDCNVKPHLKNASKC